MGISITVEVDAETVGHLAEEYESNESQFIQEFCKELLENIAGETKKIESMVHELNIENPFGFPLVLQIAPDRGLK